MPGAILVEIISAPNAEDERALIDAAVSYWAVKGYDLVTDEAGPDLLVVRKTTALPNTGYVPGPTMMPPDHGGTVLVFQPRPAKKKK